MKFRKKAVVIEAITFEELVAYGLANSSNIQGGMAWSFEYAGHGITHENDDCYLIPTIEGTMRFERDDMLITGVKGEIYPCKGDIFAMTYDRADVIVSSMKIDIDTSDIDAAIGKVEALRGDFGPELHYSTAKLDPLEQAIQCAAQVMRDEQSAMAEISQALNGDIPSSLVYKRMGSHLDELLAAQLRRVTADV